MANFLDKVKDGASKVGDVIPDVDDVDLPDLPEVDLPEVDVPEVDLPDSPDLSELPDLPGLAEALLRSDGEIVIRLSGDNEVETGDGDDLIVTGGGADRVIGGSHNDLAFGGAGPDLLEGRDGDDELAGNRGSDVLTGGSGRDRFVIDGEENGVDRITDFESGDTLVVTELFADVDLPDAPRGDDLDEFLRFSLSGDDTRLDFDRDGAADFAVPEVTSIVENVDLVAAAPTQAEVIDGLLDAGQLEVT
ncbi:MAG TPA: type I secretion C-terminal target domain-containing protein [Geminicoccaceae bacterium]|nr:type I secretion C-terminal target domain-containing protein [Geminicoccaceae bacterium]